MYEILPKECCNSFTALNTLRKWYYVTRLLETTQNKEDREKNEARNLSIALDQFAAACTYQDKNYMSRFWNFI